MGIPGRAARSLQTVAEAGTPSWAREPLGASPRTDARGGGETVPPSLSHTSHAGTELEPEARDSVPQVPVTSPGRRRASPPLTKNCTFPRPRPRVQPTFARTAHRTQRKFTYHDWFVTKDSTADEEAWVGSEGLKTGAPAPRSLPGTSCLDTTCSPKQLTQLCPFGLVMEAPQRQRS